MHILAFYIKETLPILRRVKSPFHQMASRGYSFSFMQQLEFQASIGFGADLLVVQNLVIAASEMETYAQLCAEKTVVYDLTDSALLAQERVQETIRRAALVTVPNTYLKKEVALFAKKVRVLPSMLDINHFMQGRNASEPTEPIVGCFGPHDWHIVKPVIEKIRRIRPRIHFWGDEYATAVLGDLVTPISYTTDTYPAYVRSCALGLCPCEGYTSLDTIWAHEYGILCRPVLASSDSSYSHALSKEAAALLPSNDPDRWTLSLINLLSNTKKRAQMGQLAFKDANMQRNTLLCEQYRKAYREELPHLS